jgi:DNA polymerase-3 subunit gamma/tau
VIFILATTEAHKLPETIVSRTQRFTFKPIANNAAIEHLRSIAESEKVTISDEALGLLAEHGNGSFRDSISLLDQVSASGQKRIEAKDVLDMLGLAPEKTIEKLLDAALHGTTSALLESLGELDSRGISSAQTARQLASVLREQILEQKCSLPNNESLDLLEKLINVSASPRPEDLLELALIGVNLSKQGDLDNTKVAEQEPDVKSEVMAKEVAKPVKSSAQPKVPTADWWQAVLQSVKGHNNTLYGILRMARANRKNNKVTLAFAFPFHKKRIEEAGNMKRISTAINEATGQDNVIECIVDSSLKDGGPTGDSGAPAFKTAADLDREETANTDLSVITNIFGGGEVLDS